MILRYVFKIILLTFFIGSCATVPPPTTAEFETADFGTFPEKYKEISQSTISPSLFDPYSAQYSNLKEPLKGWRRIDGNNVFGYYAC